KGVFVPVVIQIPPWADVQNDTIFLDYLASNPNDMKIVRTGQDVAYVPAPGYLRLWRKDANQSRNKLSVLDGGDYVAPLAYRLADLGFSSANRSVTFYAE